MRLPAVRVTSKGLNNTTMFRTSALCCAHVYGEQVPTDRPRLPAPSNTRNCSITLHLYVMIDVVGEVGMQQVCININEISAATPSNGGGVEPRKSSYSAADIESYCRMIDQRNKKSNGGSVLHQELERVTSITQRTTVQCEYALEVCRGRACRALLSNSQASDRGSVHLVPLLVAYCGGIVESAAEPRDHLRISLLPIKTRPERSDRIHADKHEDCTGHFGRIGYSG